MSLSIGATTSTGGVNGVSGDVSSGSISTTSGSLLIAFVSASATAFSSFQDSAGRTWTERGTPTNANTGSSNHETRIFTAPNTAAVGSHTFSMTKSAGSYWSIRVVEVLADTGVPTFDAVSSFLNSNSSPFTSGNLTVSAANSLLFGWTIALYYGAAVNVTWSNSETVVLSSTVANSTPYYYGDSIGYRTVSAGTIAEASTHDQGNYAVLWAIAIKESAQDTTPDGFSFTDQTGVTLVSSVESNAVVITGITAASTVTITGGEWQKNGGAWSSAAGTVVNGDSVKVRHTSAASEGVSVDTQLTIGGVSDTFTSTTLISAKTGRGLLLGVG